MIQMKKILCGMIAAMLLSGFAGCSAPGSSTAEEPAVTEAGSEAESAETTVTEESAGDAAETTTAAKNDSSQDDSSTAQGGGNVQKPEKVSSEDEKAARKVLETFIESGMKGDAEKMLSVTNFAAFMEGINRFADEADALETEDIKDALVEVFQQIKQYEIGEGTRNPDAVKQHNDWVEQDIEEISEEMEEMDESDPDYQKTKEMFEWIKTVYVPYEDMITFPVSVTTDDPTEDADFDIVRIGGEWIIDVNLFDTMIGYVGQSHSQSAAVAAKSIYHAVNTSLTDIDAETENDAVRYLKGTYTFKGSDFENLARVSGTDLKNEADVLKSLKYKMTLYYSDIVDLKEIAFTIEDGFCAAVAVGVESGSGTVYGSYPMDADKDEYSGLEEALTAAQNLR